MPRITTLPSHHSEYSILSISEDSESKTSSPREPRFADSASPPPNSSGSSIAQPLSPQAPRPNNGVGIQYLPTEVLIDIFTELDELEAWQASGRARGRAFPKLMTVCLHWQRICIGIPQFWRYIDAIEPVSHVALLLKRSGGCTIDVRIFYREVGKKKSLDMEAVDLVLSHAARIRSLYVNVHARDLNLVILPWLACESSFPAIESLTITPVEHAYLITGDGVGRGLSRVNQPRLRTLMLKQVLLPPPGQFWRSLRVLKLHDHPMMRSDPYSIPFAVKDFVAIFRYNATLEELYLWCYYQRRHVPVSAGSPLNNHYLAAPRTLVGLPKLRVFSIHARHALIKELLLHLVLSEDIPCIDIRASVPRSLILERPFTDLLPTHFHFLIKRIEEGVSYRYAEPHWTEFRAPPDTPADADIAHKFISLVLQVEGPGDSGTYPPKRTGLEYLVEALGWMAVRHLVLSVAPAHKEPTPYSCEHFFDAFPALEQLELRGFIATRLEMLAALGQSDDGDEDAPRVEMPRCPHLRILNVRARCYVDTEAHGLLEGLLQCARARAENRVPLDRLDLSVCVRPLYACEQRPDSDDLQRATEGLVSQIRGFVGRVEYTTYAMY